METKTELTGVASHTQLKAKTEQKKATNNTILTLTGVQKIIEITAVKEEATVNVMDVTTTMKKMTTAISAPITIMKKKTKKLPK